MSFDFQAAGRQRIPRTGSIFGWSKDIQIDFLDLELIQAEDYIRQLEILVVLLVSEANAFDREAASYRLEEDEDADLCAFRAMDDFRRLLRCVTPESWNRFHEWSQEVSNDILCKNTEDPQHLITWPSEWPWHRLDDLIPDGVTTGVFL